MSAKYAYIKQLLETARSSGNAEVLRDAHQLLSIAAHSLSSPEPNILCAEVAIELKQWMVAVEAMRRASSNSETTSLSIRRQYCTALLDLHNHESDTSENAEEQLQGRLHCAAVALKGLTTAVEEWPHDPDVVLFGISTLWNILSPIMASRRYMEVCDVVLFLSSLHQSLMIGGEYTFAQWQVYSAVCLRGVGRVVDAVSHLTLAMEAAVAMKQQRLYTQLFRVYSVMVWEKERQSAVKAKGDVLDQYRHQQPLFFAMQLTQLIFRGYVDGTLCKDDLVNILRQLDKSDTIAASEAPTATRGKKRTATSKPTASSEAFSITDEQIIEEVRSDVVLCLILSGHTDAAQNGMEQLLFSSNRRARTFAEYASIINSSRKTKEVQEVMGSIDASALTGDTIPPLLKLIRQIDSAIDGAKVIPDKNERDYATLTGCCLLWNFCRLFLQPTTAHLVQAQLHRILSIIKEVESLHDLYLQVGYETCSIELMLNNLATVMQLMPHLLSRCSDWAATHSTPCAFDFPLRWLQHRVTIQNAAECDLAASDEALCLFTLEQARLMTKPLKRVPLLRTAFQRLPPLLRAQAVPSRVGELPTAEKKYQINRSTVQLYIDLLGECMNDIGPSLLPIAISIAETLSNAVFDAGDTDLENIGATATLHLAVLYMKEAEGKKTDTTAASEKIVKTLMDAAQRGFDIEVKESGGGATFATNACIAFLTWHRDAYISGNFSSNTEELGHLQGLYKQMWERHMVHDVDLLVELSRCYILSLLCSYIQSKGDSVTKEGADNALGQSNNGFNSFYELIFQYPKVDTTSQLLRKAHATCLELMSLVKEPSRKWHISLLYPCVNRLLGEKSMITVTHPQEQLLIYLGCIREPISVEEKRKIMQRDVATALRSDPSVQLCFQTVALALPLGCDQLVVEVCEMAHTLYRASQLGWGSLNEIVAGGATTDASASRGATESTTATSSKKAAAASILLSKSTSPSFPKPTPADWEAYAHILMIHATFTAKRFQGLSSTLQNMMAQQVLTYCVNSAIAGSHGPADTRRHLVSRAYITYYSIFQRVWGALETPVSLLPGLRLLVSKPLLDQIPRRDLTATSSAPMNEILYRLSCVIAQLSLQQLLNGEASVDVGGAACLRVARDFLPPRYLTALRVFETLLQCRSQKSVAQFMALSQSMSSELQAHGWMMLARQTESEKDMMESWGLALAAAQTDRFTRARCLFEWVGTASEIGRMDSTEADRLLLDALSSLEGYTDTADLFADTNEDVESLSGTLAKKSATASFLTAELSDTRSSTRRLQSRAATRPHRSGQREKGTFSLKHVFLSLRIVYLLFQLAPDGTSHQGVARYTDGGSGGGGRRTVKVEYAMLILHYINALWYFCRRMVLDAVREEGGPEKEAAMLLELPLPRETSLWYGFSTIPTYIEHLRRVVSDEEASMNSESLWTEMLAVGDFFFQQRLEPFCFIVYSWVHFSSSWKLGGQTATRGVVAVQQMALVRVCNFKMEDAAARCGTVNSVYATPQLPTSVYKTQLVKYFEMDNMQHKSTAVSESSRFLMNVVLLDAEMLLRRGYVTEAASLANIVEAAVKGREADAGDVLLKGVWVRSVELRWRSHGNESLRLIDDTLHSMSLSSASPSGVRRRLSPSVWIQICREKLFILCSMKRYAEAVEWASSVRAMLLLSERETQDLNDMEAHMHSMELSRALETWAVNIVDVGVKTLSRAKATCRRSSATESELLHVKQLLGGAVEALSQATDLQSRITLALAKWYQYERVSVHWAVDPSRTATEACDTLNRVTNEVTCFEKLLAEVNEVLFEYRSLTATTTETLLRSSLTQVEGHLLFLIASCRLEVSHLVDFIRYAFHQLTMADLHLPTTDAPAQLEEAVLQFFQGSAVASCDSTSISLRERWSPTAKRDYCEELINALRHYKIPEEALQSADTAKARELLFKAWEAMKPWPRSQLYATVLHALVDVEVQRELERRLVGTAKESYSRNLYHCTQDVLASAWSEAPIVAPKVEKFAGHGKRNATADKGTRGAESKAESVASTTYEMEESTKEIIEYAKELISMATSQMSCHVVALLSCQLANLCVLFRLPSLAAAAVELTQAAHIVNEVWTSSFDHMVDCAEARAWNALWLIDDAFSGSEHFKNAWAALLDHSTATQQAANALHFHEAMICRQQSAPPSLVSEGPVISIVLCTNYSDYYLVAFRHPDGTLETRRYAAPHEALSSAAVEYSALLQRQLASLRTSDGRLLAPSNVTSSLGSRDDMSALFFSTNDIVARLLSDFLPSIGQYCPRMPLYLCVDCSLQPYPLEEAAALGSGSYTILRHLSAYFMLIPNKELFFSLGLTAPSPVPPAAHKGSSSVPLFLCDVFGDYPASVEAFRAAESSRNKLSTSTLVTCSTSGAAPSGEFLKWLFDSTAPSAVLVNTCGELLDVLPWNQLCSVSLKQVAVMVMADWGVNEVSHRREERSRTAKKNAEAENRCFPRWLVGLLLIARGARCAAMSTFPSLPGTLDVLSKRCQSGLSSCKALVDQLHGKNKEAKLPCVTLFGTVGSTAKGKG